MKVFVEKRDVTRTSDRVAAICTLLSPHIQWYFGSIDRAINDAGGSQFHCQAGRIRKQSAFYNKQVIYARQEKPHNGNFDQVIFVVDSLESPLKDLVFLAIEAAHIDGMKKIALPVLRNEGTTGVVSLPSDADLEQMVEGIDEFVKKYPKGTMTIYLATNRNDHAFEFLTNLTTKYR